MKIGIISDTHDHRANVFKAVEIFNDEKVSYVIHAGDIISSVTANALSGVENVQIVAVFGNCDGERLQLRRTIEELGGEIHEEPYRFVLAERKIFVTHKPGAINEVIESGKYDLVIYGHTHVLDIRKLGRTLVVNPGQTTDWFPKPPSVVIVETDDMSWKVKTLAD
ncbi:MAG: metallophosphoesterase [Anaerohalosphaeraceae bacterium]|nr:metallophosphoesterase [Anaerohalosphaeraceae bacterium]